MTKKLIMLVMLVAGVLFLGAGIADAREASPSSPSKTTTKREALMKGSGMGTDITPKASGPLFAMPPEYKKIPSSLGFDFVPKRARK